MSVDSINTEERLGLMGLDSLAISREQLALLFSQLSTPQAASLKGAYLGKLYAVEGLRFLPAPLRALAHMGVNSAISPWKGKCIEGKTGGNMLLSSAGDKQLGFYSVKRGKAYDGSGAAIVLDYDVPENPPMLWKIRGELREISEQYYLARMLYQNKSGWFTVLYFTLRK